MNEEAINKILGYMENNIPDPRREWNKDRFEEASSQQWAVEEILKLIFDNSKSDPQFLIEDFIILMIRCGYSARKRRTRRIFQTAEELADDILINLFYHEGGHR